MATIDGKLKEILTKFHSNPREALWDCHGKWIAYHAALEEIARNAKITFDPPQVLEANGPAKCAAVCVTGRINGTAVEWSIGEASPANNKNAYPFAMAEKRAKDRVILKLIGLHGMVYSEEEADDFKEGQKSKPEVADTKDADPRKEKAREAFKRIQKGLRDAKNVKGVDALMAANSADLDLISDVAPNGLDDLIALAETRRMDLAGAAA